MIGHEGQGTPVAARAESASTSASAGGNAGRDGVRSIAVEDIDGSAHVVHGNHGLVAVSGRLDRYAHVSLTWVSARPKTVVVTCTDVASGDSTPLYIGRNVLLHGGKPGNIKVDVAGEIAFIVVSGAERATGQPSSVWLGLNWRWLTAYLDATTAIVPVEPPLEESS